MWYLETLTPSQIESLLNTSQVASQASNAAVELFTYFLPAGSYSVGRKDSDLSLPNDKAVSRKHARLEVQSSGEGCPQSIFSVTELGSTYGTSVNGENLAKETPRVLEDGDIVRFGAQWSGFRVRWLPLVFCVTRMNKKDKLSLKASANAIGAEVVSEWSSVGLSLPHSTAVAVAL